MNIKKVLKRLVGVNILINLFVILVCLGDTQNKYGKVFIEKYSCVLIICLKSCCVIVLALLLIFLIAWCFGITEENNDDDNNFDYYY